MKLISWYIPHLTNQWIRILEKYDVALIQFDRSDPIHSKHFFVKYRQVAILSRYDIIYHTSVKGGMFGLVDGLIIYNFYLPKDIMARKDVVEEICKEVTHYNQEKDMKSCHFLMGGMMNMELGELAFEFLQMMDVAVGKVIQVRIPVLYLLHEEGKLFHPLSLPIPPPTFFNQRPTRIYVTPYVNLKKVEYMEFPTNPHKGLVCHIDFFIPHKKEWLQEIPRKKELLQNLMNSGTSLHSTKRMIKELKG